MVTMYDCKVITDTVDLNGNKKFTFRIEEPPDILFYRSDMKIQCQRLDASGGISATKQGRITGEKLLSRDSKGKKIEIYYEPDARTMPGNYRLEVVFKRKKQNGQKEKICTRTADFRVVDTTPLAFVTKERKVNYLIDLHKTRSPGRKPVKLYLEGPRGMSVKLDTCYVRDEKDYPCSFRNPMFAGTFKKTALKLSGGDKQDEVYYYPGLSPRSGKVIATAYFGKHPKKLQFSVAYSDVKCNVLMGNVPIMKEQSIYVPLKHSLQTNRRYKTTIKDSFSILGPRNSRVTIKMNWNGYSYGHKHHLASFNKLATGHFSNFTQSADIWLPGSSLTNEDGIVDYRNIEYSTSGMSGVVRVVVAFKTQQNDHIDEIIFYLRVMYQGLKKLDDGDNIKLVGDNTIHPRNHYGTQELISAIKKIAKAYGEAYDRGEFNDNKGNKPAHKELYINDMSLQYGGRFDCEHKEKGTIAINPFRPSHFEHMFGEEVDIQTKEMNDKQRAWFKKNAKSKEIVTLKGGSTKKEPIYGFIRCDAEPGGNPNHFHCSIVDVN